jgi:hypothetical protein
MPRGRPCKCPYDGCGSTATVSKGARITKTLGIRKIRRCKSCGRKFTPKHQKPEQVETVQAQATDPIEPIESVPTNLDQSGLAEHENIEL